MRDQSVAAADGATRVLGGDQRLQQVGRGGRVHQGRQQRQGFQRLLVVPAGAVLVGQQDGPPVRDPGVPAGVLEQHQGEQGVQLVVARDAGLEQGPDHAHQPDGLGGQLRTDDLVAGRGRVARREGQVGHVGQDRDAGAELRRRW